MKVRCIGIILFVLLVVFIVAIPAYADTPLPDTAPTIEQTNIYRNILETGDMLVIIYANIPYATIPSNPVTLTYVWRLFGTDGTTELGNTTGYAYNDDGYGYNVYSMYWTAAEFTALSMVWETNYIIRLSCNPTEFDEPPVYNFTINVADYSSLTDTDDVKAEISERVITLASDIDIKWGIDPDYSLLTQNETATVLSIYGEAFFRGAIWGLQAMAPGAFSVVIRAIDIDYRDWSDNYTANLTTQWGGSWADTAQAAGKALFGTDYDLLSMVILFAMAGGLLYGNLMLTSDHWNGMIDIAVLGVIGARLAMFDLAFLIMIAALCWIYIGTKIWFGVIR